MVGFTGDPHERTKNFRSFCGQARAVLGRIRALVPWRRDVSAAEVASAAPDRARLTGGLREERHVTPHKRLSLTGLTVAYEAGVLYLLCHVCQQGVVRIAVQAAPEE